jgi:DNA gyrase subunit B
MKAEYGHEAITFLEESNILDEGATDDTAVIEVLRKKTPEGEPYEASLVDEDAVELTVRAIERASGLARTIRLPRGLFATDEYQNFARVHSELRELAGTPPFDVRLGKKSDKALSFEDLRRAVLDVAKEGISLQRFKGLGEMNAEQLFETTMDPSSRTLQRVTMDDGAAADLIFSMLMGDKVEPRREFIEKHAREVGNLDV